MTQLQTSLENGDIQGAFGLLIGRVHVLERMFSAAYASCANKVDTFVPAELEDEALFHLALEDQLFELREALTALQAKVMEPTEKDRQEYLAQQAAKKKAGTR